jgi:predicted alpha-1,6-mannanase (GH76 family)
MNDDLETTLCNDVEDLFLKHCGKLSASDLDAVFSRLRRKALNEAPAPSPKASVKCQLPDLVQTNLEQALETYDWTGYAPVAMDGGKLIESIVCLDANGNPPLGYQWAEDHTTLIKSG